MLKQIFALIAGCICATASGAVTYQFASPKYTTIVGSGGYTTNMAITGSITTTNPLPVNMPLTDIGPAGSNLATAWSFNDGVATFTPPTSTPFAGAAGNFRIATNAAGRVTAFSIKLMLPGNACVGCPVKVLTFNSLPEIRGETGGLCSMATSGVCRSVTDPTSYGAVSSSSVLDIDADGRADALSDGLLMLRYMFGLRGAALITSAVSANGTRKNASDIEAWLGTFAP